MTPKKEQAAPYRRAAAYRLRHVRRLEPGIAPWNACVKATRGLTRNHYTYKLLRAIACRFGLPK